MIKQLLNTILIALIIQAIVLPHAVSASSALVTDVAISNENVALAKSRSFTFTYAGKKFTATPAQVRTFFKTRAGDDGTSILQLRPSAIYDFLNVYISPKVNTLGENSRFQYVGANLHLIEGGSKGKIVDGIKTSLALRSALVSGKSSTAVAMKEWRPTVFSAEDFKKLSFPTLLARGESSFAGSPANRIHNIVVATEKYNGLVLMPGEEFSFNQYLGNVDGANGYLPELVIKENVTTPEFGGGICQVSTTAFRAAMQAGLKITTRKSHSYPVAYYGAPGYDATIYPGSVDLQFTNDTGNPVLIKTRVVGTKVIFDIYGTSDGRIVTVNGPYTTGSNPDGSIVTAVAQLITKNGKSYREQNFVSKYQSPDKFPITRAENGER